MGSISGTARLTAAALALSVTLSIVWSLAAVAHPAGAAKDSALAQLCASAPEEVSAN
jgi:hypothetical protein